MNRFLKFIPSEEAFWLMTEKPNAFRLLTHIANTARRTHGSPDGISVGQCHLKHWTFYKLTEREYRTAKEILVKRNHIKIIQTNRTRKKSTIGSTTASTLVEICSTTVYDINPETIDDRNDDRATTERRQTRKNKKEKKEEPTNQPNLPSEVLPSVGEEAGRSAGSELRKEAEKWLLNANFKEQGCPQEKFSLEEIERILDNFPAYRIFEVKKFIAAKTPKERSKIRSEKGYFKKALFEGWK